MKENKKKITEKPKDIMEGFGFGLSSMVSGIFSGISDIILKPVQETKNEQIPAQTVKVISTNQDISNEIPIQKVVEPPKPIIPERKYSNLLVPEELASVSINQARLQFGTFAGELPISEKPQSKISENEVVSIKPEQQSQQNVQQNTQQNVQQNIQQNVQQSVNVPNPLNFMNFVSPSDPNSAQNSNMIPFFICPIPFAMPGYIPNPNQNIQQPPESQ